MTRVALILAIVLAAAAPAAGQGTCTLDQLAGTYVFESRGQSALASGPTPGVPNHVNAAYAPAIIVGEATLHADGRADGFYWGILGTGNTGLIPIPWEGEITDFENCSGVMTYTVPMVNLGVNAQITERFAVTNGGKELRSVALEFKVLTDPPQFMPVTWTSVMYRRNQRQCGQSMLTGNWVMQCQSLFATTWPGAPFTHVAAASLWRLAIDAAGDIEGPWSIKWGPNTMETTVEGRWTVAEGCTLDGTVTSPGLMGRTMIIKGLLYDQGKEFLGIPLGTTAPDGSGLVLSPFASCRAIRVGR